MVEMGKISPSPLFSLVSIIFFFLSFHALSSFFLCLRHLVKRGKCSLPVGNKKGIVKRETRTSSSTSTRPANVSIFTSLALTKAAYSRAKIFLAVG